MSPWHGGTPLHDRLRIEARCNPTERKTRSTGPGPRSRGAKKTTFPVVSVAAAAGEVRALAVVAAAVGGVGVFGFLLGHAT